MQPYLIAEIGINHNGDMDLAKQMIDAAVDAGFDAVKFQKRTIDKVYTQAYLAEPRESPWGTTQRAQKEGLEFGEAEFAEIERCCQEHRIAWFASAWDLEAQEFLRQYEGRYNKVASAQLINHALLQMIAEEKKHTFISTGMSELEEIDAAVEIFRKAGCPFELMHCNSQYPMPDRDANLNVIQTLRDRYGCDVGYSGHETGIVISMAAAAIGISSIERHITLDRAMYGSDQAASVELVGFRRLVDGIRLIETAFGDGVKILSDGERAVREKLMPIETAMR